MRERGSLIGPPRLTGDGSMGLLGLLNKNADARKAHISRWAVGEHERAAIIARGEHL
jgi:hypothetical protein